MWPLIRPKPSVARDTVGQATAVIDRVQIPELLSELVMVHTGTARSIGVLSVRIAVAGAPEFDFAPNSDIASFKTSSNQRRLRKRPPRGGL